MIDAKELRIGNWILFEPNKKISRWVCVKQIHLKDVLTIDNGLELGLFLDEAKPIPLTPEILGKCGFEEIKFTVGEDVRSIKYVIEFGEYDRGLLIYGKQWMMDDFSWYITNKSDDHYETHLNLKSLHQLQNLYFSLTQKELEIKL